MGRIDTSKLGLTLSHEHIATASAGIWQSWPELFGGRAQFVRQSVDLLKQAKDEGLVSFQDVSPIDPGRDVRMMEEISRKSGVLIIAATGHWLDPSRVMNARTVDELADFFHHEIEDGIDGTGIRPGVIKVANGGATINGFVASGISGRRARQQGDRRSGDHALSGHARANRRSAGGDLRKRGAQPVEGLHRPQRQQPGRVQDGAHQARVLPRDGPVPHEPSARARCSGPAGRGGRAARASLDERLVDIKILVEAGFARQIMLSNDWSLAMIIQPTANDRFRRAQNPTASSS